MKSDDIFQQRRKALEESFFAKKDQELLARIKADLDVQSHRQTLKQATGITDDGLLDHLVKLGVTADVLTALTLAPLLFVAWSDGHLDPRERAAILSAADEAGVTRESATYQLLNRWMESPPDRDLEQAWVHYIQETYQRLTPDEQVKLRDAVMGRAKRVAEAAGGLLGLGTLSSAEQAKLQELAAVFA